MKRYRTKFYQWLHIWALARWRKAAGNPNIKGFEGKVSAHAIVRYMQRIEGRDITGELLTLEARALIREVGGNGKFVVNNILYTVVNGKVMTVARPNPGEAVIAGLNKNSNVKRRWSF